MPKLWSIGSQGCISDWKLTTVTWKSSHSICVGGVEAAVLARLCREAMIWHSAAGFRVSQKRLTEAMVEGVL